MKELKRMLLAATMLCILAVGVFAEDDQGRGQKPPPKVNPPKVKVEDKRTPPPDNGQRGGKKGEDGRRGKP